LGAAAGDQVEAVHIWKSQVDNEGVVHSFERNGLGCGRIVSHVYLVASLEQRAF
jgi:hypothetical protein